MSETEQRAAVIAEARKWCGTPYHHAADVLGAGCDCGMLIVRAFVDTGLVALFDPRPYAIDWHLHRDEERYLGFVFERTAEVETPLPGDVVVFKHGRTFSHGGIVTAWDDSVHRIVHASWPARRVLEETIDGSPFAGRTQRYFSFWKVPRA